MKKGKDRCVNRANKASINGVWWMLRRSRKKTNLEKGKKRINLAIEKTSIENPKGAGWRARAVKRGCSTRRGNQKKYSYGENLVDAVKVRESAAGIKEPDFRLTEGKNADISRAKRD